LAEAITTFVEKVRRLELRKAPSISEAIDWARGLILLNANALDKALVQETLGLLVKYDEDRETVEGRAAALLKK
jgi:MoxR-like ATPase